jgi:hypothetical protein
MPKDTSIKDTSYMDTSYQDTSYQDMPYQDMPYTTWKIRDTGEQKQVKKILAVGRNRFCRLRSLLTLSWGLRIPYF